MEINAGNFNELLVKAYAKAMEDRGYSADEYDSISQEIITESEYFGPFELDGYEIGVAADVGGGEGDGEERYVVFKIFNGTETRYFRYDGYYASWDGSTFDDLEPREVLAQEKVIVVFE